jgi:Ala-tRNA(Pro) deacylase
MAIPEKIKNYLLENAASYSHKTHPVAYTSQEIAAVDHIPGEELAKTVVLRADENLILAVLPADRIIDMQTLKKEAGCEKLVLAYEGEFTERFPGCRRGAMPPFGKLFGLPVYCDRSLAKELEIEFNAGTHTDTIRMEFSEFERMEAPIILNFSEKFTGKPMARVA